jgi:uncharacterized protein involved in exopolysaccharide biosynthesis
LIGEAAYHINEQIEQDFIVSSGLIHRADKESMDRQLASLSTSYAEAQRRSLEATSRAEMLTSQRAGDIDSTLDALSSPLLQHLRQRMVEVSSGVGSGNSTGPSGASQTVLGFLHQGIEAETQHLVKAAQNEATVAQQNEAALHADLARLDARLMVWQANERHRIDLHRAVTDSLDDLHEERRRFEAQSGRGEVLQSDVEIVSFAEVPDRPSFPDPLLYMAGTFAVIGLFSGLIFLPSMRVVRAH